MDFTKKLTTLLYNPEIQGHIYVKNASDYWANGLLPNLTLTLVR